MTGIIVVIVMVIVLAVAVQTSSIETQSNKFLLQTLANFSELPFLKCLPILTFSFKTLNLISCCANSESP